MPEDDPAEDEAPGDPAQDLMDAGLIDPSWKRMDPVQEVWMDAAGKRVVVGGHICLREGLLEMFACLKGTKEHESIVAAHSSAKLVHATLLALGIEPGKPCSFDPEYQAVTGPSIRLEVVWKEDGVTVRRDAREMVIDQNSKKPLEADWVFGGSRVVVERNTGESFYCADGGEFACVSNFSTAMLDLPFESSDSAASLTFMAEPRRIPPLGTRVLLVLSRAPAADGERGSSSSGAPAPDR